jgi:hypothetical protein
MKTFQRSLLILALAAGLSFPLATRAAVDWRFPVGLTFASGLIDVNDAIEEHFYSAPSWDYDNFVFPVGLQFSPYAEFDFGLGVGVTLGPPAFFVVYEDYYYYDYWDDYYYDEVRFSWSLPIGLDLRYSFHSLMEDSNVCPYVRAGLRYTLAGGDFLKSGDNVGFYGGAGVEFLRTKKVSVGVEAGYDTSELTVKDGPYRAEEDVEAGKFMISIFAVY